jgi:hypothetical protein
VPVQRHGEETDEEHGKQDARRDLAIHRPRCRMICRLVRLSMP